MKFLIKSLGWDGWRAAYEVAYAEVRAEGGAPLPFDPDAPPAETAPDWPRPDAPAIGEVARRAAALRRRGPGHRAARAAAACRSAAETTLRWLATNVRPQKQAGLRDRHRDRAARRLHRRADAASSPISRWRLQRRLRAHHARPGPRVPLGAARATSTTLYERLAAAGLALPDAGTIADVTSCPGAESCRLAVTQSRGLGKLLGDHLRERPTWSTPRRTCTSRSAAARTGADSTTSPASASRAASASSRAAPCRSTS